MIVNISNNTLMIPTVNFWTNNTQKILNTPIESASNSISKSDFFSGVKKMQDWEWIWEVEALTRWLELFKSQWRSIEGVDIDSEILKYKPQLEEIKKQEEDTWFFESLWEVLKKRGDKWAEILTAWVQRSQGQWKLESGVQYAANLLWWIAELWGTAIVEWLDAVTPESIQDQFKSWLESAFDTKGGEWVIWKLEEVNRNMETLRELNPRAARNFEAFWNSVDAALTFYGWKTVKETAKTWAKQVSKEGLKTWAKSAAIKTWDIVSKVWSTTIDTATSWVQRTFREAYKLNQETIEQAFKNPEIFSKSQKIGADEYIKETAENIKKWILWRAEELSELGKEYSTIRKWAIVSNEGELFDVTNDVLGKIERKNFTKADLKAVDEAISYIDGYKWDLTDIDVLSLRKQIDSILYDPNTGMKRKLSPQWERSVSEIRRNIDDLAKDKIKGLRELDKKFSPEIKEVNKIKSLIFDKKWELKDRYIADISNLQWKGKEIIIERVKQIDPDIESKLSMYRALKDLDNVTQGFKVWTYQSPIWTGVSAWIWAILGWPSWAIIWAFIYQIITNPKVGIEIVKKLSIANEVKKSIIKKMKDGVKLKAEEAKALIVWVRNEINEQALKWKEALGDKLDDLADKIGARAKFMDDTGKSLDDFGGLKKIKDINTWDSITLVRWTWWWGVWWGSWEAIRWKWLYLTDNVDVAKNYWKNIESVTIKNSDLLDWNTILKESRDIIKNLPEKMKRFLDDDFEYSYNSLIRTIEWNTWIWAEEIAEEINKYIKSNYKGIRFNIWLVNDRLDDLWLWQENAFLIFKK